MTTVNYYDLHVSTETKYLIKEECGMDTSYTYVVSLQIHMVGGF